MGSDDFLIDLDDSIRIDDILDKIEAKSKEISQVFKFLKIKTFNSTNILDRPSFYKYTIDRGEPIVDPKALLGENLKIFRKFDSIFRSAKDLPF